MKIVAEEWRFVAGDFRQWQYEVSSLGRVRREDTGRIMTGFVDEHGYARVGLSRNGTRRSIAVHRLVAMTFLSGFDSQKGLAEQQVNHRNGDKLDNRASNLEWVTCRENHHHAFRNGLRERLGGGFYRRKLTAKQAVLIRESEGRLPTRRLAKWFGVSAQSVRMIRQGKTYVN